MTINLFFQGRNDYRARVVAQKCTKMVRYHLVTSHKHSITGRTLGKIVTSPLQPPPVACSMQDMPLELGSYPDDAWLASLHINTR